MDIKTKELEYLLNNYWCVKEKDPDIYFNIKNNLDYYKDFIREKLGSKLIVNERFIKLEKIPSIPKVYMGINDFSSVLEYIILFIVLLYLEDKTKGEQFILSNLTDFIVNTSTTLELDNVPNWNIFHHRKYLVSVIHHLNDLGIIKVVEENNNFTEDNKAEALYEATGLANFYIREFNNNILEYDNLECILNDEFNNQNEIGDVRRYKVYRHLLYSLVTYKEDLSESELDYLRKFRSSINNELSKYTKSELELTKNMAVLLFEDEGKVKFDFPNNKVISDIVLLVNKKILEKIENNELTKNEEEVVIIAKEQMDRIIKDTRSEYKSYFSKNYREMTVDNFLKEVINYMLEYDFLRIDTQGYKILPMVSKLNGYINKNDEQMNLFGGLENEV